MFSLQYAVGWSFVAFPWVGPCASEYLQNTSLKWSNTKLWIGMLSGFRSTVCGFAVAKLVRFAFAQVEFLGWASWHHSLQPLPFLLQAQCCGKSAQVKLCDCLTIPGNHSSVWTSEPWNHFGPGTESLSEPWIWLGSHTLLRKIVHNFGAFSASLLKCCQMCSTFEHLLLIYSNHPFYVQNTAGHWYFLPGKFALSSKSANYR